MTHDPHDPYRENIPAYALGALDADEAAALETHLQTCASCQTELAEYRALSDSLLTAVPPRQPPPASRRRLQNRLPGAQSPKQPRLNFSLAPALGLAVLALFILNIFSLIQLRQIQAQQAALLTRVENAQLALTFISSPNVQTLPIEGEQVTGMLLLDRQTNQAVLVTRNLPPLPPSQTYQIWLVKPDNGRVSVGTFRPEGQADFAIQSIAPSQPFTHYLGIGVTIEPKGGSDAPTGQRVLKVDF
ncbi:MAG: anti-sigma factor [Anaerolineales bacterium]